MKEYILKPMYYITHPVAIARPIQTANRMGMSRDYFGDTPCKEVPNDNATIIASNCQQCSVFVKGTRNCKWHTIEGAIELLRIVLSKRLCNWWQFENHSLISVFFTVQLIFPAIYLNLKYWFAISKYFIKRSSDVQLTITSNYCIIFYLITLNSLVIF